MFFRVSPATNGTPCAFTQLSTTKMGCFSSKQVDYHSTANTKPKRSPNVAPGYADASKPVFKNGMYTGLNDEHFQNGTGEGYSQQGQAFSQGVYVAGLIQGSFVSGGQGF